MHKDVFTIGHSTHSLEHFIALLHDHAITAVCDVRSTPYSRINPQFNRETLKHCLKTVDISYVFLGDELGARSKDPACYERGRVQYDRLARTQSFKDGLDRVRKGMKKYRVVLMCAEKEPVECHRTILVARHLVDLGINVLHILADGEIEDHPAALSRLAKKLALPEYDMFRPHDELLADVYRVQEERIAYSVQPNFGRKDLSEDFHDRIHEEIG